MRQNMEKSTKDMKRACKFLKKLSMETKTSSLKCSNNSINTKKQ